MSQEFIEEMARKFHKHEDGAVGYTPFSGIRLKDAGEGWAEAEVVIEPHHLNPFGNVHGGIIFTIADVIGGYAVLTLGPAAVATASSNIIYMNPGVDVKKIIARAQVLKLGKRLDTVKIDVYDDKKKILATVNAVYANLKEWRVK